MKIDWGQLVTIFIALVAAAVAVGWLNKRKQEPAAAQEASEPEPTDAVSLLMRKYGTVHTV